MKRFPHRQEFSASRRRGTMTMELLITLPILFVLLLGIFEFSFLMYARSDVVQAARAGARLATLNGVEEDDVRSEVGRALAGKFQAAYQVRSTLGTYPGDEVIVTVRVPMTAAAPNLLWPLGYSIRGRDLIAETRMVKE